MATSVHAGETASANARREAPHGTTAAGTAGVSGDEHARHAGANTMQAQMLDAYGDAPFRPAAVPRPVPGAGQVLVRVHATSVNPADYKARELGPALDFVPELPAHLGMDVAGVVEAVGPGVTAFRPGDAVYGCAGGVRGQGGALAEYLAADARLLAPKPVTLAFREAAALPLVAITAYEALVDRARVAAGQTVLVHGGAGGVGHVAVQLAKHLGATVVATDGTAEKLALARALGADHAVNYRDTPVDDYVRAYTGGRGFDVVFDTAGGPNLTNAFAGARLGGTVVTTIALHALDLSPMHAKGLTLHAIYMLTPMLYDVGRERHGEILRAVAALVDAGRLTPRVDPARFALTDATAAYDYAASGRAAGKVVVEVAGTVAGAPAGGSA
jgi:NADPH:quinone reductase-like Zn-dependent oxidoreductase